MGDVAGVAVYVVWYAVDGVVFGGVFFDVVCHFLFSLCVVYSLCGVAESWLREGFMFVMAAISYFGVLVSVTVIPVYVCGVHGYRANSTH